MNHQLSCELSQDEINYLSHNHLRRLRCLLLRGRGPGGMGGLEVAQQQDLLFAHGGEVQDEDLHG